MALICACHRYGWPVARGGSGAIADALAAVIAENGGRIETGRRVRSLAELPAADAVVLDLAPAAVAEIAGERLPGRVARAYRRYRHGPGAFKVDLAVEGGVPWADAGSGRAGTVHAIGSFEEIVLAEREVDRGRMPERPFVLVGQQYLADPARSRGDVHPVWAYAHVPNGYPGDATEAILDQVERFAPGLRERIVGDRDPLDRAARGLRRQLRRRRHHDRRQHAAADSGPAAPGGRSLRDRHPRRLHLLGGDPAGAGRPRDVRLRRRAVGAARARAQLAVAGSGPAPAAREGISSAEAQTRREGRRPAGTRPSGLLESGSPKTTMPPAICAALATSPIRPIVSIAPPR